MKKASEYYEHAEECRQLARTAVSEDHRAMLENMARTWEGLAEERQKRISRANGIARIDGGINGNAPNDEPAA